MLASELKIQADNVVLVSKPKIKYRYDVETKTYTAEPVGYSFKVAGNGIDDPLDVFCEGAIPEGLKMFSSVRLINLRVNYIKNNIVYSKCDNVIQNNNSNS